MLVTFWSFALPLEMRCGLGCSCGNTYGVEAVSTAWIDLPVEMCTAVHASFARVDSYVRPSGLALVSVNSGSAGWWRPLPPSLRNTADKAGFCLFGKHGGA